MVVSGKELFDCGDQVGDAVEDTAADRFVGQLAKPALDEDVPIDVKCGGGEVCWRWLLWSG